MAWLLIVLTFALTAVVAVVAIFGGFNEHYRWKKNRASQPVHVDFTSSLELNRSDGWNSLDLLFVNRSNTAAWVETATLNLTGLEAHFQTIEPAGQAVHPVRQTIPSGETLSVSVAKAIYEAAGSPQGDYSCGLTGTIRYRILENWREASLENYSVEMQALGVLRLRRVRAGGQTADSQRLLTKV